MERLKALWVDARHIMHYVPRTRWEALLREARKRGLRKEEPVKKEPEVYGRRPPRR